MDNSTSAFRIYLGHQVAKASAQLAGISSNPTSNEILLSQFLPVLEDELENARPLDIPAPTWDPQVNVKGMLSN